MTDQKTNTATTRIVVKVSGGIVQSIVSDRDVRVLVLDYDVMDASEFDSAGGMSVYPEFDERHKERESWQDYAEANEMEPLLDASYTAQLFAIAEAQP